MKKYEFKLQNVMDLRQRKEDEAKKLYSEAMRKFEEEKQKLAELGQKMILFNVEFEKAITTNPQNIEQYYIYKEKLEEDIKLQQNLVNLVYHELELAKANMLEIRKEKKKIEKIREKDFEKYLEEIKKIEQNFIDEIATEKFNEKKKNQ